ncbi:hypothetical protein [Prevotella histicola]|uniref:hypothetical protein n=1 Tax=Prevotella histicola TaxID=470565 RepID=UPI0028E192F6|nr:hypothetical protein [Prevotella histicola]
MSIVKDRLFINLNECLNKLTNFDVQSLMPLFYVLVASHEGRNLSIPSKGSNIFASKGRYIQPLEDVDGFESDLFKSILFKSIRNSVSSQ